MSHAPRVVVRAVETGVRTVRLRLPFRFGAVTLTECDQLFVRAEVDVEGRLESGHAAEMLVPKWFDKRADRSQASNVDDLLGALRRAVESYRGDAPAAPFALFTRHYAALMDDRDDDATALSKAFGQAVLDRAVVDATCRALGVSFFAAVRANQLGIGASELIPDLEGFAWPAWLDALAPLRAIAARHTVGLLDELHHERYGDDGLPASLPAVIARYQVRYFKIKLGGDVEADAGRLLEVLAVLDRLAPGHRYTLDGNEQYADAVALVELFERLAGSPGWTARQAALLYIEQPFGRDRSLATTLELPALPAPLLLDEGDGTLDAFPRAAALGWRGVSSKACKGLYKSIVNRARCDHWNDALRRDGHAPAYFMSAEDLTCQAGISVQQDLALAALLGLEHAERNGHHYGDGFGTASAAERDAFRACHPDLYAGSADDLHLRIDDGRIAIGSLFDVGYAHRADPDRAAMRALPAAPAPPISH